MMTLVVVEKNDLSIYDDIKEEEVFNSYVDSISDKGTIVVLDTTLIVIQRFIERFVIDNIPKSKHKNKMMILSVEGSNSHMLGLSSEYTTRPIASSLDEYLDKWDIKSILI